MHFKTISMLSKMLFGKEIRLRLPSNHGCKTGLAYIGIWLSFGLLEIFARNTIVIIKFHK